MVKAINVHIEEPERTRRRECRDVGITLLKSEDEEGTLRGAYKNPNTLHVGE